MARPRHGQRFATNPRAIVLDHTTSLDPERRAAALAGPVSVRRMSALPADLAVEFCDDEPCDVSLTDALRALAEHVAGCESTDWQALAEEAEARAVEAEARAAAAESALRAIQALLDGGGGAS